METKYSYAAGPAVATIDLLDKFRPYADAVEQLSGLANPPFRTVIDQVLSPFEVVIAGRKTIMIGSNNYLGLTFDPELIEASKEAAETFGVGTTGSRMANGSFSIHQALEHEMAQFMGKRHAIVFTTGHHANLAMIGTLGGPQDVILLDAECHASIYDACRLGSAQIIRFRHNSPADLEKKLARLDRSSRHKLIVVEGCYSMSGDLAPLDEIVRLKNEYNAYLLVDEAHSLGVFGHTGRGAAEHFGVDDDVEFITGTFSKSLAGTGGFCVSHLDVLPLFHYCARAYMFTASGTPASIASVRAALQLMRRKPELRDRLWNNARRMRDGFQRLGFAVVNGDSPIVSLLIGDQTTTVLFWEALVRNGIYCNLFLPPATPKNGCMLRTSYSAAHTREVLDLALSIFERVGREMGILKSGTEPQSA
ncbi:MAG: aminotransferase class I/II-fold pyridoxal phosphate-dependent enzyme [Myxococcales bacterium]|nr:aminotransferase class I/II-fold pyridoxal phosphate-dependent enzyme [Myxococcales bacterium]